MTIYQLKALNIKNGGRFFDRKHMRYFGETLKSFSVTNTPNAVILTSKVTGITTMFNKKTGRVQRSSD